MLSKSQRLNLKTHFKWATSGKRMESTNFILYVKSAENTHPLVGVSISSKFFKKANFRNKAKRLSFDAISPLYSILPKNINLVMMPKQSILNENRENLFEELNILLKHV